MNNDIGLEQGTVKLVPHNPKWKILYAEEAGILDDILTGYFLDIQHIGSTAIPGIKAKPIIDIAIAVENLDNIKKIIEIMESNKYLYRGEQGIPDRHLFVKSPLPEFRTHHIHLMPISHPQWETHQLFRDYLISHPESAIEYIQVKIGLKKQHPTDRVAYTDGKAEFIQRIIEIAQNDGNILNHDN